ncbi:MAG: Zn-dependent alcohol dehydrogenase [Anaerolineales bacterium]|nr:zinc-binding dehydrogenase [Anaerolineae bacterium]PWB56605.1 MAG: Zn-dependent alcohol dehydrogenase [Anaerolineales bacterium]
MLAAVYHGPNDLRLEDVPIPGVEKGEILVKVVSASICGTDLRILHGNHRMYPPSTIRIPGHEVVGTIAEIGTEVDNYTIGQRVFVAPNTGCGHCEQCVSGNNNLCANYDAIGVTSDGGFAEYVRIPANSVRQGNVIPISEAVDPAVAALVEPFACVLRGQNALRMQPGEVVLIMGAGPIGVMHLKLTRARGAGRILVSEPAPQRAAQARQMGADRVVNPTVEDLKEVLNEESNGRGADIVIVAAPVHVLQESALDLAAIGGRINFFGGLPKDRPVINFNSNLVHYKELVITGTTACSTADCWQATRIVNSGLVDLSDIVSQRFPLAEAVQAFAAAEDGKSLKIVLVP